MIQVKDNWTVEVLLDGEPSLVTPARLEIVISEEINISPHVTLTILLPKDKLKVPSEVAVRYGIQELETERRFEVLQATLTPILDGYLLTVRGAFPGTKKLYSEARIAYYEGTSVDVVEQVLSAYNSVEVSASSSDSQVWIQPNIPDKAFVDDVLLHCASKGLVRVGYQCDKFKILDLSALSDPKLSLRSEMVPVFKSSAGLYGTKLSQPGGTLFKLADSSTGQVQGVSQFPPLFLNDNTHPKFWEAYFSGLERYAKLRDSIVEVGLTKLVDVELGDTVLVVFPGEDETISGKYVVIGRRTRITPDGIISALTAGRI